MRSAAEAAPSHLYAPDLAGVGETFELSEAESRYLRKVCRARVGDFATATDGAGNEARVRVASLDRSVRVTVETRRAIPRPSQAWLLCGAPEGRRADWLIEKLGELGVAVFQPVNCDRAAWGERPLDWARIRRLAEAALRQSRRAWLMEIRAAAPLEEAIGSVPPGARRCVALEAAPAEAPAPAAETPVRPPEPGTAVRVPLTEASVVGPSAGFSDAEVALLIARGFAPIRLADARLRTETAALAWASGWAARSLG